jgi:hypothetical protein
VHLAGGLVRRQAAGERLRDVDLARGEPVRLDDERRDLARLGGLDDEPRPTCSGRCAAAAATSAS